MKSGDAVKNIRRSVLRDQFPPQSGIVLAFVNPPDIYFESKVVGSKRAPAMNPRPQNPDPFFSSKSQFLDDEYKWQNP